MAGAKIALTSTSGELQQDSGGNAKVNLPLDDELAGYAVVLSEIDDGTVLGTRYRKANEISEDFRARCALDTSAFNLSFEGTTIAQGHIQQTLTTMAAAQASGFLQLNSASITTINTSAYVRSYRTFPLFGSYPTYFEIWARCANTTATNSNTVLGAFYAGGSTIPTDGVYFRYNAGGQLTAYLNFAGSESVNATIAQTNIPARDGSGSFDPSECNHYLVAIHNDEVEFWINDALCARLKVPATQGSPSSSSELPIAVHVYNTGTAASAARTVSIGFLNVSLGDMASGKPWSHVMAGGGGGAYQIQPGTASGPTVTRGAVATAGWPASATTRTAGTWTATSAPAVNSLGGMYLTPAISTLTADVDYPIFAYLNPAGTASLPGKTLYITGVRVGESVVTTVAATNSIAVMHIVGVSSTAAATNTADAANTLAPRGVVIGSHGFGATDAVGTMKNGYTVDFTHGPLVCPPGTYVHFIVRLFGTVTTNTLVFSGSVAFIGYSE